MINEFTGAGEVSEVEYSEGKTSWTKFKLTREDSSMKNGEIKTKRYYIYCIQFGEKNDSIFDGNRIIVYGRIGMHKNNDGKINTSLIVKKIR